MLLRLLVELFLSSEDVPIFLDIPCGSQEVVHLRKRQYRCLESRSVNFLLAVLYFLEPTLSFTDTLRNIPKTQDRLFATKWQENYQKHDHMTNHARITKHYQKPTMCKFST